MKFISTNRQSPAVSFKEAIFSNLAPDGGLYFFDELPAITRDELNSLQGRSFKEISCFIGNRLIGNAVKPEILEKVINSSLTFTAPLSALSGNLFALELFHGPTHAFKDFAAQFMARLMVELREGEPMTILVATSGDTGSAVAQAFWNLPNVKVVLLFPKGYVSPVQEAQLTSFDNNVTALECEGNFDDCQKLVKTAFMDKELTKGLSLVSANSINLARLIPQTFYYFSSWLDLKSINHDFNDYIYSVPSGNFGNLTAGMIAKKMGLPISRFIASTNLNRVVPDYLATGEYSIGQIVHTISNAMDVANPSNFVRIQSMENLSLEQARKDICGYYFSDDATKAAIAEIHEKYNYLAEPHSAIGYLGIKEYNKSLKQELPENLAQVFLCTAHPAKFPETVREVLQLEPPVPSTLAEKLDRSRNCLPLKNSYDQLKSLLTGIKSLLPWLFVVQFTLAASCFSQDIYLKNKKPSDNPVEESIYQQRDTTTAEDALQPPGENNEDAAPSWQPPARLMATPGYEGNTAKQSDRANDLTRDALEELDAQTDKVFTDHKFPSEDAQIEVEQEYRPVSRDEELINFEIDLAKRNFSNVDSDKNLSQLITAYRKLMIMQCFEKLKASLIHDPRDNSAHCNATIKKILELDSADPVAVCAKTGFNSNACRSADLQVQTTEIDRSMLDPSEQLEERLESERIEKLVQKDQEIFLNSFSELSQLKFNTQKTPQMLEAEKTMQKKFLESAYKLITLTCKGDRYLVRRFKAPEPTEEKKEGETNSPLNMGIFNSTPTPVGFEDTSGYKRFRLLPQKCLQYLDQTILVEPTFSTVVCTRAGIYTPRCIEARSRAASKVTPVPGKRPLVRPGDGLAEF